MKMKIPLCLATLAAALPASAVFACGGIGDAIPYTVASTATTGTTTDWTLFNNIAGPLTFVLMALALVVTRDLVKQAHEVHGVYAALRQQKPQVEQLPQPHDKIFVSVEGDCLKVRQADCVQSFAVNEATVQDEQVTEACLV